MIPCIDLSLCYKILIYVLIHAQDSYEKKEHKDSKEYKEKKDDGYEKKEHKDKPKSPSSSASGCFLP